MFKAALALSVLLLVSAPALASDKEVGYCGAYHLMLKNHSLVGRIMLKAKSVPDVQAAARELVDQAHRDPVGASKRGALACILIGIQA